MTTGRINQVASINNFAHRCLHATTNGEQASTVASVIQGNRDYEGTEWERFPCFISCTASERAANTRAPQLLRECVTNMEHMHRSEIPQNPSRRPGWTKSDKPHEYHSRGKQHRNRNHATKRDVSLKRDCMPTVRCKSTEPASKNNPNTTHTPSLQ